MRDLILFVTVFGLLPFIFKRPVIGIVAYIWISLMNPHRLAYGAAYDFPFAAIIVVTTLIGLLLSKEPKRLPLTSVSILLLIFFAWMTFTTFFAMEPDRAWKEWNRVMKTFFMVTVMLAATATEKQIRKMIWIIALSIGFYGLKGGVFTIISGGSNRVLGPASSYIADNNHLALALIMTVPLIWFLQTHISKSWIRWGLLSLTILTALAAVGTYSRGALLAGASMLFFLWLKSSKKIATGVVLILVVPLVYWLMPEQWFDRMQTIGTYKEDASAMGRINAWLFAVNLAKANFIGGGFDVFTPKLFHVYAPDPLDFHVAHSIYFQVLGEHGIAGLLMFLTIMVLAFKTGTKIIKFCKEKPNLKWHSDLAAMLQVCIVGYAVGGAFLSLAYFDMYYYLIGILVLLEKILIQYPQAQEKKQPIEQSLNVKNIISEARSK